MKFADLLAANNALTGAVIIIGICAAFLLSRWLGKLADGIWERWNELRENVFWHAIGRFNFIIQIAWTGFLFYFIFKPEPLSRIEVAEGFLLAYVAALFMIVRAFVPVLRLIKDITGSITDVLDVLRQNAGAPGNSASTTEKIIEVMEKTVGSNSLRRP